MSKDNQMSQINENKRKPFAINMDNAKNPSADSAKSSSRSPKSFSEDVIYTSEQEDPFLAFEDVMNEPLPIATARKNRFGLGKLALGAFGILLSFAFGLWADQLIRDLFTRSDWLGYTAIISLVLLLIGLFTYIAREVIGILRLNAVQKLKDGASIARDLQTADKAKRVVADLTAIISHRAETAKGRAELKKHENDIIDAPQLLDIAERELMSPLDKQARNLIMNSTKRVSLVTAISPRAIVDLAYVLFETTRLVRSMAELYGGRPGTLGMFKLMRDVVAHLAVTGSIAVGDSLFQQVVGHGLASKLSARLGEGVINGLMTARIGISAMDLCRPLPFHALKRPSISDFLSDITPSFSEKNPK